MGMKDNIRWFKTTYGDAIKNAVQNTVFDLDMLTAIACQETGSLWGVMRHKNLTPVQIAALCCGDTLDEDKGRKAFPRNRQQLMNYSNGPQMFAIARQALLAMAEYVPGYEFAPNRPDKFCHGFGVFQYDIQYFQVNPDYFLQKKYEVFENSLNHAIGELKNGLTTRHYQSRNHITDLEFCEVAICYNTGGFDPAKGLKQGHPDNGKFYGEFVRDYLALSRTVNGSPPLA